MQCFTPVAAEAEYVRLSKINFESRRELYLGAGIGRVNDSDSRRSKQLIVWLSIGCVPVCHLTI